jgi:biotin transporter BioY
MQSAQRERPTGGTVFGFPLAWNLLGHHAVNYADTYRYVGFPAFLVALVVALPVFGVLWIRAKLDN